MMDKTEAELRFKLHVAYEERDHWIRQAFKARDERDLLRGALADLVQRCDTEEGMRADGSNIQTMRAHAALGDKDHEQV